jgi:RHS repeat-associated protein
VANAEDRAVPQSTKQGAKGARPSSHQQNYDAAGRLDYVTNFNGSITDYSYDNANRLTSMENRKSDNTILATYAFTLDGNGNRTNTVQTEQHTNLPAYSASSYTYNLQKNRLLSAGANAFTYDNEGQLATGYGSAYTFDYEHRLTATGTDQFTYDVTGKRLQATRNGVVTRYIYDASGNLLAEADGSNNITKYYIQGAGLLAAVTQSNQLYCYHFNATGHTMAMTDSAQVVVNKFSYDPYGNITNQSEGINQPFKYVGQFGVITEPNGFYYMRARYYDPQAGRFISEDPIGFDGGDENLYAYVGNNPVMGVDAEGLFWFRQDWQTPGVVGRQGTPVEPGGGVSVFIEQKVPAGYTFGTMHDAFVGAATSIGIPDAVINIPSMIPVYAVALGTEVLRALGILDQPTPPMQPTSTMQPTTTRQATPCK